MISLYNIEENTCFNMHLSIFLKMQVLEDTCHSHAKLNCKFMKVKHHLELLYFQVDEGLMCMDIVSTFHII